MKYCGNCFNELDNMNEQCPFCGYRKADDNMDSNSNALPEGTILYGKYLLGKVLGEGGFGITYLAWDLNLKVKIAIKEFFPCNMIIRNKQEGTTIQLLTESHGKTYEEGLKRYVNEASILASLDNIPGIVRVKDFFYENGTAYIVMEYVDGISLKDYVKGKGGSISWKKC